MSLNPRFPELQALLEWIAVHPGDCASRNERDEAAIREHNHDWSHRLSPCWSSHSGSEL